MSLGISVSPELSSWRTMELITRSTRSGSTGRLRKEMWMERASLSRSKGSRWPFFLITVSSRSCTRSNVVKRAAQFGQNRRRRIAARSSVGRESLTCVSSHPQNGQRIRPSLACSPALAPSEPRIDREPLAECAYLLPHRRFHRGVRLAIRPEPVQHLDDELPHLPEFRLAKAARGGGWTPQP